MNAEQKHFFFAVGMVVLLLIAACLLLASVGSSARTPTVSKEFTAILSCTPTRDLLLAAYSDGTVRPVPDYVAECQVKQGGKLLYEGSFSDKTPSSKADAVAMEKTILADVVAEMRNLRDNGPNQVTF